MNEVQGKLIGKTLTVSLIGHVDSGNAAETEKEIDAIVGGGGFDAIVIDAEKLTYISSAGLRVLLRLKKAHDALKVVNVSPEVYEVFDMTGFTEIIHIEKAYREFSVDGCEVIGQGANGKVYRLDGDTIVKVYMNPDSLSDIHRERELARKAFVLGIPTAIPYDVVKVGDKYGSVFELLNAQSFSKLIVAYPEKLEEYVKYYTDLLKQIHGTVLKKGELPDMNKIVLGWVNDVEGKLPQEQWDKLYKLVSEMPEDVHMIHGDYHTKNIMMQNDEVLLIDMDTLAVGNPVYEFAFMYNAYVGYEETLPENLQGSFLGLTPQLKRRFWQETLKMYFDTNDEKTLESYLEKAMVVSYLRILRRSLKRLSDTEEGKKAIANSRAKLAELLPKVDSLAF